MKLSTVVFIASSVFLARPAFAGPLPSVSPSLADGLIFIEGGRYLPFTSPGKKPNAAKAVQETKKPVAVAGFFLDRTPVTNEKFLAFTESHPEWRKSRVRKLFADARYLQHWKDDTHFSRGHGKQPVTNVSWFAANAYCESLGQHLPTTDQWEFALHDRGRDAKRITEKILAWYAQPNETALKNVGTGEANGYGVYDLTGLVWEWTEDFNSFLTNTDSRDNGSKEAGLVCGGGSQMGDPSDYASFMRYSLRSSLKANYTTTNLGFRCAKDGGADSAGKNENTNANTNNVENKGPRHETK